MKIRINQDTIYNMAQIKILLTMMIVTLICWVSIITMSVLGAREFSFHLIDLEVAWGAKVWNILWLTATASFSFILGGACFIALAKAEK